jgi:hypothetical protein
VQLIGFIIRINILCFVLAVGTGCTGWGGRSDWLRIVLGSRRALVLMVLQFHFGPCHLRYEL